MFIGNKEKNYRMTSNRESKDDYSLILSLLALLAYAENMERSSLRMMKSSLLDITALRVELKIAVILVTANVKWKVYHMANGTSCVTLFMLRLTLSSPLQDAT